MSKSSVFFHEDNYNQKELLPFADAFGKDASYKEIGLPDCSVIDVGLLRLYSREHTTEPLKGLNISLREFEDCLKADCLLFFDEVFTGYSTYRILKEDTRGVGFENHVIFYQFANGIVINSWIVYMSLTEQNYVQPQKLTNALINLGSKYNLILLDYINDVLVLLSKESNLSSYIEEYL